jgi:hypothetical protein
MRLKQTIIIAFILSAISLLLWEFYWRSQGYYPTLNDDKSLWAIARGKVESASKDDFVILGSSRTYFDIQLKTWQTITGNTPIQLSFVGSSPLPTFHDIVNNTNYTGTVLLGVTPGLFFSTTYPEASPWKRPQSKVDFYKKRTYAQLINYQLSIPLQKNLVLMSADEEEWSDDIDLKTLLGQFQLGNRPGSPIRPPFNRFGDVNTDRNMSMANRTVNDTAFANSIIRVWHFFGKNAPPPDKESTMNYFLEDASTFKQKGGNLILLRCPSSGGVRMGENHALPRYDFWDDLIEQSGAIGYHFEDYQRLKHLSCPEESHLSFEDAKYFTQELLKIMETNGDFQNSKSN